MCESPRTPHHKPQIRRVVDPDCRTRRCPLCSFIPAWFASSRERRARRAESQRAALYDLQEAALGTRRILQTYRQALPNPSRELGEGVDDATSSFETRQRRLLSLTVGERATTWLNTARQLLFR